MEAQKQVIAITGASAGVGRAVAHAFAKEGASIGLIARGKEALEKAKMEVEDLGGKAEIFQADVSDADQIEKATEAIENKFGPIDIWINNAMASVFSPIKEMTSQEFRRVTEVTYLGYVHGTLSALKRMLARNRGTIIQVGSALSYRSIPLQSAYCAAKHAVMGFTESLRVELLHDKSLVKVCMVQLPAHNTPQFGWVKSRLPNKPQPVPPIFQPEVAAKAILHMAHHPRREMYVGFPTVKAIIGDKIAPSFADWYLSRMGYKAQQTHERVDPNRLDNLWEPVPGDHGTHGTFDHRAKSYSVQVWMNTHRGLFGLIFLFAFIIFIFWYVEKN